MDLQTLESRLSDVRKRISDRERILAKQESSGSSDASSQRWIWNNPTL